MLKIEFELGELEICLPTMKLEKDTQRYRDKVNENKKENSIQIRVKVSRCVCISEKNRERMCISGKWSKNV